MHAAQTDEGTMAKSEGARSHGGTRPGRGQWTPSADAALRALRAEGRSWQAIGQAIGLNPVLARERGRRIGAHAPPRTTTQAGMDAGSDAPGRDLAAGDLVGGDLAGGDLAGENWGKTRGWLAERPALAAGHPASWGALVAGTLLDNAAYGTPPPMGAAWPDDIAAAQARRAWSAC